MSATPGVVLVLGGTAEARELAARVPVLTSLAGRVSSAVRPPGDVRVGGFGGVAGLVAFLRESRVRAVVDATHPFAALMSAHAVEACAATGTPLLRLQRPGFAEEPGDCWTRVPSLEAAADRVTSLRTSARLAGERGGHRADVADGQGGTSVRAAPGGGGRLADVAGGAVLLATGRQELAPFRDVPGRVVLRAIERPHDVPPHWTVVLGRPPWSLESERALLREHDVDVLVTKDSGGAASAKLVAAREAGLDVVMVDRPPVLAEVVVETFKQCVEWLARLA